MGITRKHLAALALAATFALTGTSAAYASGGSGGGGGGGGGGGTAVCTPSATVKATAGYRPGGANMGALWTSYTAKSCPGLDLSYDLVQTNTATGEVIWGWTNVWLGAGTATNSFDNDWLALATTFRVDLVLHDNATGAVVASASSSATTPKGKGVGTLG